MKAGETINFALDDGPCVAVIRSEWFHSENPPPRDRQPGMPWFDLTVLETAKGAFVARSRSRVKEPANSAHSVARVRTVDCAWHRFDNRETAIDWLAERSRDGDALAGKALARLRAEEV